MCNYDAEVKYYRGERVEWYRPVTLDSLLNLKKKYPQAKLVCGNTEIGEADNVNGEASELEGIYAVWNIGCVLHTLCSVLF